jgi:riboflavin synthase
VFTGLVQKVGTLAAKRAGPERQTLVIAAQLPPRDRGVGASVAIDGVCLTVTESNDDELCMDAAFETLRLTTLGLLAVGQRVNLEPALRVGDALGGHLVSGHVDGVGTVRTVTVRGDAREVWVDAPAALLPFIAVKGSICVDGTSLTVNAVDPRGFSVGLVPHTLQVTTLDTLHTGRAVNLEVDLVARYVARLLDHRAAVFDTLPGSWPASTGGLPTGSGSIPTGSGAAPSGPAPAPGGLSVDALVEAGYLDPGEGRR